MCRKKSTIIKAFVKLKLNIEIKTQIVQWKGRICEVILQKFNIQRYSHSRFTKFTSRYQGC